MTAIDFAIGIPACLLTVAYFYGMLTEEPQFHFVDAWDMLTFIACFPSAVYFIARLCGVQAW